MDSNCKLFECRTRNNRFRVTHVGAGSAQLLQHGWLSSIRALLCSVRGPYFIAQLTHGFSQVFDAYQGSNVTYLSNQLFNHYSAFPHLSQLLSEGTLASVLISTQSSPVAPLDLLSNTLVSPLFYGLQSSITSDIHGRSVLKGVRVQSNLPGNWTLQCGVDGVMMSAPVFSYFFLVFFCFLSFHITNFRF